MSNKKKKKHASRKPGALKPGALKSGAAKKSARKKKTRGTPAPKTVSASKAAPAAAPAVLDSQKLRELYSAMLKCRMPGEAARTFAATRDSAQAGREAMLVGAAAHALEGDSVITTHPLPQGFDFGSVWSGKSGPRLVSHPHTTGAPATQESSARSALEKALALAGEMKEQKKVALVFRGADTSTGLQRESLAQAAREKLPLVCLAETSLAAIAALQSQPGTEAQPANQAKRPADDAANAGRRSANEAPLSGTKEHSAHAQQHPAHPIGTNMDSYFPQIVVDGHDVVAVFRVAQEAVRRARGGHGPSLILCVMPEKPAGRSAAGPAHDPLAFMERYLRRRKLWAGEWKKIG